MEIVITISKSIAKRNNGKYQMQNIYFLFNNLDYYQKHLKHKRFYIIQSLLNAQKLLSNFIVCPSLKLHSFLDNHVVFQLDSDVVI